MTSSTVNSNRFTGRFAMLAAACLFTGSLGVAQAATSMDDVPSVVVNYSDLDLSTSDGVQKLYRRISLAARQVCPFGDSRDLQRVAVTYACRQAAIARAVSNVHSPQLVALSADRARHG
jgi:UrcA family protein